MALWLLWFDFWPHSTPSFFLVLEWWDKYLVCQERWSLWLLLGSPWLCIGLRTRQRNPGLLQKCKNQNCYCFWNTSVSDSKGIEGAWLTQSETLLSQLLPLQSLPQARSRLLMGRQNVLLSLNTLPPIRHYSSSLGKLLSTGYVKICKHFCCELTNAIRSVVFSRLWMRYSPEKKLMSPQVASMNVREKLGVTKKYWEVENMNEKHEKCKWHRTYNWNIGYSVLETKPTYD